MQKEKTGDVVLRDGSTVRIRVMRPSDEAGLCALLSSLSNESRWLLAQVASANGMIRELKTYPLLTGFRGSVPCDVSALEDGLLRVSAMVEDLPQIAELDCKSFRRPRVRHNHPRRPHPRHCG